MDKCFSLCMLLFGATIAAEIHRLRKKGRRWDGQLRPHQDPQESAGGARPVPRPRAGGLPHGDRGAGGGLQAVPRGNQGNAPRAGEEL